SREGKNGQIYRRIYEGNAYKNKNYTAVLLKSRPTRNQAGADLVSLDHIPRELLIILPISDDTDYFSVANSVATESAPRAIKNSIFVFGRYFSISSINRCF